MRFEWNRKQSTSAAYSLIVLVLAILFFQLTSHFEGVLSWTSRLLKPLSPIVYGFILAYLLDPIMCSIEYFMGKTKFFKKLTQKHTRGISLLTTYIITLSLLTLLMVIVFPRVYESAAVIGSQIQDYVASAEMMVENLFKSIPPEVLPERYANEIKDMVGDSVSKMFSILGNSMPHMINLAVNLGNFIINAIVGFIVSCYLLSSKEKFLAHIRKVACAFLPQEKISFFASLTSTTDNMFGRFITGKILDSFIIGVLCFFGMYIMNMPNTILISFIVGLTNVIPYFGPFFGAIPSFILIAFESPAKSAIFLIFIFILQQLDGNIIGPLILGDSTGLSPFWIVSAILFFGGALGVPGMIIGVPTMGVAFWLLNQRVKRQLEDKKFPLETEEYDKPIKDVKLK